MFLVVSYVNAVPEITSVLVHLVLLFFLLTEEDDIPLPPEVREGHMTNSSP